MNHAEDILKFFEDKKELQAKILTTSLVVLLHHNMIYMSDIIKYI